MVLSNQPLAFSVPINSALTADTIMALSPRVLAYIGDGVYELWVRQLALSLGIVDSKKLHQWVAFRVQATFQAYLPELLASVLTPEEEEWLRRGRNVSLPANKRNQQKLHRQASGFETLIGIISLTDNQRLQELLALLETYPPFKTTEIKFTMSSH